MTPQEIKKARLDAIVDEVKQFHPLLELLLPKLPRVQDYEYTHGVNEFGADFVLARSEEIFNDIEYAGVIAKIGKIPQDMTDIERQIEECELERCFKNGRKKIFLSEIFIITTGAITFGAQQKIHLKYKTRKIQFIDGTRLTSLIEQHLPNYWTDVSLQIGTHLHHVWSANESLDKSLSLLGDQYGRFYIDQDVYESEEFDRKKTKPARRVDIFDQIEKNNVLLIEGGMGSGKSKLLRKAVDFYSTPQQFLRTALIPVPTTFKEFIDKHGGCPTKLVQKVVPDSVRKSAGDKAKYLILLDGADEKDLSAENLVQAVLDCARKMQGSEFKCVITSRWCEGYERNSTLRSLVKRLELHALSTNRLIEFIRKLCRDVDVKSRLIEDLKKSSIFKELPKSPIAAILLAQLLNENAKELPSNLTELYSKYTELSLGRWDVDKNLQTQKEYDALSSVVSRLAERFMDEHLEEITVKEAKDFFAKYLSARNFGLDSDKLFNKLKDRCDLVYIDESRDKFRFKHKTFIEFFYAKAYQKKPLTIDSKIWNYYWSTAYYFYVGLQKDCPELLEAIISIAPKDEGERWMRLVNLPNYLLAGFASPYNIVEKAFAQSMIEAAELYYDVSELRIKSPFCVFPKMHFLWMVQHMVRRGYGFDFFHRAITSTALEIEENCTDPRTTSVATFFLSIVGHELGDKSCFDHLLKNHHKNLGVEFELAIRHETESQKQRSHLVKKMDQRVTRSLKENPKLDSFIKSLYSRPIRFDQLKEGEKNETKCRSK